MACERSGLVSIKRLCGGNAPNLTTTVYYTPMSEFSATPAASTGGEVSTITLISGGKWQTVEISNKDGVLKGGGKDGFFEPSVEGFHPKTNAVSTRDFTAMLNVPMAVVVVDGNNDRKLLLDVEFEYDPIIDGNKNGYNLKWMSGKKGVPFLHLASGVALPLT